MFDFRLFYYVRLFNCSISERSIVFDCPNSWVSSIVFDCRTQSKSVERLEFDWVRLPNVRLTTPGITNDIPRPGQNYNFNLLRFSQTCELLSSKAAFTIGFFTAISHNYDHKQRTLKHRNIQNGSKSINHKSQTMTF